MFKIKFKMAEPQLQGNHNVTPDFVWVKNPINNSHLYIGWRISLASSWNDARPRLRIQRKQDSYNVTLKYIHETTSVMEKQ